MKGESDWDKFDDSGRWLVYNPRDVDKLGMHNSRFAEDHYATGMRGLRKRCHEEGKLLQSSVLNCMTLQGPNLQLYKQHFLAASL